MTAPRPFQRNIILILTDQQRGTGEFESVEAVRFRSEQLHAFNHLCAHGTRFTQHRISSAACAPSRASLLTGYSPWCHGVTQTDGLAKMHDDPKQTWLAPETVPTVGHRFQAAGWRSVYFGKWHLSHEDLPIRDDETSDQRRARYEEANLLSKFGFDGWSGPEPHGADPMNSGLARDADYVDAACDFLSGQATSDTAPPFFMVLSLVNPHDIVFWPAWSLWQRKKLQFEGVPPIGASPTEALVMNGEPQALSEYRARYPAAYGPKAIVNWLYRRQPETYRRFYYGLMKQADRHVERLLKTLESTGLVRSTHVVMTSDHGELLGAHGALHQKWYNAFEETIRVPMVIAAAHDDDGPRGVQSDVLTDHLDLVPTLLSLADIDKRLPPSWRARFNRCGHLTGQDMRSVDAMKRTYFVSTDDILSGETQQAALGRRFPSLGALWPMPFRSLEAAQRAVECVVVRLTQRANHVATWKLIRYFSLESVDDSSRDEYLLYNLSEDGAEETNVAAGRDYTEILSELFEILNEERGRLRP